MISTMETNRGAISKGEITASVRYCVTYTSCLDCFLGGGLARLWATHERNVLWKSLPLKGKATDCKSVAPQQLKLSSSSSENVIKEPPPKPPGRGVVVVFEDEEEEVTKEKALKDAPPLRADQSTRHSFVTPLLGETPSGDALRFPSATRGGGLEDVCGAGQPDAAPDVYEQLLARAHECGRPASDAEDVQEGWRNGKIRDRLATFDYRERKGSHPSLEDAKREAARKTRWEKYEQRW